MPENQNIILIEQLGKQFSKPSLYEQLIPQLQKDINRAGIDYEINTKANFKDLFVVIEKLLLEKLNNAFNEYLNLLYAVDVSEREIRNCKSDKSTTIAQYASYLILKREWQKIYYRNTF